jgi:hypothetical protein
MTHGKEIDVSCACMSHTAGTLSHFAILEIEDSYASEIYIYIYILTN